MSFYLFVHGRIVVEEKKEEKGEEKGKEEEEKEEEDEDKMIRDKDNR